MNDKTITILTNNYNGSKYINRFFNSLFQQSYKDWILIFYDNFSTDNSIELVKKYNDCRIKIIYSTIHFPLGIVRQQALNNCKTNYTAIWDIDDLSDPRRLELQLKLLIINPDICLVSNHVKFQNDNDEIVKEYKTPISHKKIKNKCIWSNPFVHSSVMFKTNVIKNIGGYDINYNYSQDYNLYIRLILDNQIFATIDKYLTIQNFTDQTLSSKKEMQIIIYKDQIRNLREAFKIKNINLIFKLLNIFSQIFYICKIYVYNLNMKLKKK